MNIFLVVVVDDVDVVVNVDDDLTSDIKKGNICDLIIIKSSGTRQFTCQQNDEDDKVNILHWTRV